MIARYISPEAEHQSQTMTLLLPCLTAGLQIILTDVSTIFLFFMILFKKKYFISQEQFSLLFGLLPLIHHVDEISVGAFHFLLCCLPSSFRISLHIVLLVSSFQHNHVSLISLTGTPNSKQVLKQPAQQFAYKSFVATGND